MKRDPKEKELAKTFCEAEEKRMLLCVNAEEQRS